MYPVENGSDLVREIWLIYFQHVLIALWSVCSSFVASHGECFATDKFGGKLHEHVLCISNWHTCFYVDMCSQSYWEGASSYPEGRWWDYHLWSTCTQNTNRKEDCAHSRYNKYRLNLTFHPCPCRYLKALARALNKFVHQMWYKHFSHLTWIYHWKSNTLNEATLFLQ
jgi:hypothetical protein